MNPRRRPALRKTLILALTRRERAELRDLRTRISGVRRVLNALEARRDFILSRVPDHKIIVPTLPASEMPKLSNPKQPTLF